MNNTFGKNIIPTNDSERINELNNYKILNSPKENSFTKIAYVVAKTFNVPIALISFVSEHEVFFKANYGFSKVTHADRGESLCALAILENEPLIFENTLNEPCLLANPNVVEHGIKFYAGVPLKSKNNLNLGTLCIIDYKQRYFHKEQISLLEEFADIVLELLNMRKDLLNCL